MKTLFQTIVGLLVLGFLWSKVSVQPIPKPAELETVSGEVVSVEEVAGRNRLKNGNVLVTVRADGLTRQLVSYDRTLLQNLRPGMQVRAGLFDATGDSEIWTINSPPAFTRTFADTYQLRATRLKSERRWLFLVTILITGYMIGVIVWHKNRIID